MPPRNKKFKSHSATIYAEPKSTRNESSLPNVPVLYFNKLKGISNFSIWREKFAIYVGAKYGRCQELILTGRKYVPPAIPAPPADELEARNDPHGIKLKCYQKQVTSQQDVILRMEEDYPKIYNEATSTFSRESEEMVRQHTDFAAADRTKRPGLLIMICAKTHQQPQSGAVVLDADTATARYYSLQSMQEDGTLRRKLSNVRR